MRLVSLLPSATEIVHQLGLTHHLVGVSHECDYPASISFLPKLTRSRLDAKAPSPIIHQSVGDILKNAVSVYELDVDLLESLKPDYIITQDLCDVCAVSFQQVEGACQERLGSSAKIISLRPTRLGDIWDDLSRVANALGVEPNYSRFRQDVDRRVQHIRDAVTSHNPSRKKVLTIEWLDPVFVGGMWLPEMIEIAGGETLLGSAGEPAPVADRAQLESLDPDVVVIKPCGFDLQQTLKDWEILQTSIPWNRWERAIHNRFVVDGNAYFNRPGPRIIDSLEILAGCTHPDLFPEFIEKYCVTVLKIDPDLNPVPLSLANCQA